MSNVTPAAPETKSAASQNSATGDGIAAVVAAVNASTDRIVREVKTGTSRAALNDTRQRAFTALRASAEEREREVKRGRGPDPVVIERERRMNAAIDNATDRAKDLEIAELKSRMRDLEKKAGRPPAPSFEAPQGVNAMAGKSREMAIFRKATLHYLKTGQETFDGVHLRELERKASVGQSNPDGGFLLHPEYDTGPIEKLLYQYVPMRQIASVRRISAATFKKPFNLRGRGAKWVGETDSRPATNTPKMAELEYPAMELYAEPLASQAILEDSYIDIESWLAEEAIEDFAITEAEAFITGDGNKKPMGLLAYPKVVWSAGFDYAANFGKTVYVATGADGDLVANNYPATGSSDVLVNLPYKLKQGHRQNASWMANRQSLAKFRTIKNQYGDYIWKEGDVSKGQPSTLSGYPVTENEQMPDFGSGTFPVAFGDYKRSYLIVDRVGMQVLRDPYTQKPFVLFYTRKRVGGGMQNFEAMVLLKASAS